MSDHEISFQPELHSTSAPERSSVFELPRATVLPISDAVRPYGVETHQENASQLDAQSQEQADYLGRVLGQNQLDVTQSTDEQGGKHLISTFPYAENLYALLMASQDAIHVNSEPTLQEFEDLMFANTLSGECFGYRSLLSPDQPMIIDPQARFTAYGGSEITLPPIGRGNVPLDPVSRGLWSIYKKIEPLVMLHEAGHYQQAATEWRGGAPQMERDAWAYAIQQYRSLKEQGLDLLPGVSATQLVGRVELGLVSYDLQHTPQSRQQAYSGKAFAQLPAKPRTPIWSGLRAVLAVLQTAKQDQTLITEAIRPDLSIKQQQLTLQELLAQQREAMQVP